MGVSWACQCGSSVEGLAGDDEGIDLKTEIALLKRVKLFSTMGVVDIEAAARLLERREYQEGDIIIQQGEPGTEFFIIEDGEAVASVQMDGYIDEVKRYVTGGAFGERALLRNEPRAATVTCRSVVQCLVFSAASFKKMIDERDLREELLRGVKILETLSEEQIAAAGAALSRRAYKKGEVIIRQGMPGHELFIVDTGTCAASVETGYKDVQEVRTYKRGDFFGEIALMKNVPRAATITAIEDAECLVLSRDNFEKRLGPLSLIREEQYLHDPRKLIADFYKPGDSRGPKGSVCIHQDMKAEEGVATKWFAVYRPTTRDSIAKMLGKVGVGKGLNVKGKSAQKNRLSGFVPFLQVSDNDHKSKVEPSPPDARVKIFYRSETGRKTARLTMASVLEEVQGKSKLKVGRIKGIDDWASQEVYGLEVPEVLLREVYINKPDISPMVGWETGRDSNPFFMGMNLQAVRSQSQPPIVIYQHDIVDPLNPLGLLIAYAEKEVKPVVSDFDTFTIGSKGMTYEALPQDQCELVKWSLNWATELMRQRNSQPWTKRWMKVLQEEDARGFHPELPKFGFGDPTSYRLIEDVVNVTEPCGAIRHGAECFNFYFPQDLDPWYLVVWEGFDDLPWCPMNAAEVRNFLMARVKEGYRFPLNPMWCVRDEGWYELLSELRSQPDLEGTLNSWYPPDSGILEQIDAIHQEFPQGFKLEEAPEDTDAPTGTS